MVHNSHEKVCACCFEEDGTVSHLYFDCRVSKKVQENMFVWLDMKEIFFKESFLNFESFRLTIRRKVRRSNASLIWMIVVLYLWLTSNDIMFNNLITLINYVVSNIKCIS